LFPRSVRPWIGARSYRLAVRRATEAGIYGSAAINSLRDRAGGPTTSYAAGPSRRALSGSGPRSCRPRSRCRARARRLHGGTVSVASRVGRGVDLHHIDPLRACTSAGRSNRRRQSGRTVRCASRGVCH
jgi:hypothetical protein